MKRAHLLSCLTSAATGLAIVVMTTPVSTAQTPAAPPQPALQATAAGDVSASPASTSKGLPMWVIRDADSTIYLTGTVHLLPDGVDWHSARLDAALNEAGELYLELAEIADPDWLRAKVMPIVEQHAQWDGPPLSTMLTEQERTLLAAALKKANAPPDVIAKSEKMQPWYTAYALGRDQYIGDFKSENGIDQALARIAIAHGIPVKGMEEVEDQIDLMIGLTPDEQVDGLKMILKAPESMKQTLGRVASIAYGGWVRGEINGVEGLAILMSANPDNDAMLLDRNENWVDRIEEILDRSGVTFIAVGAAHLVGPDSLQSRLKLRGIKAERY
ncbi:MAG: TraB/GumN family protein [Hyphomonadaceae bacterium]